MSSFEVQRKGLTPCLRCELPALAHCSGTCMRHIQYILMEVISNAMQHARARGLWVTATTAGASIQIELRDDGQGMAGETGNGLRTMHERAALIGATLVLEPADPGVVVRLSLPLKTA